ncbi:MAG: sulfide/dihydroorotate dehydrogenase-like FAD/NAD-binding protein, partial [Desulfobacterales bacterium]|nr:sulfide/dihydroorotate dehydrogenase-like FAD/NAD-binding protein [Desulfobacterales bacterium]
IIVVTADGSRGVTGHIKDGMKFLEERKEKIDHAHFVGCTFMMMLSAEATKPYGIPTIVSLNTLMVDGTGMCGVCRVLVDGQTKFACVDGPDFDGHLVDWDLVFARKRAYEGEE